ncbi:hypothetical protein [Shimia sp. R9_3]|uniref:hypothetical protein n=1 Tax=Shimia sp. R9_3 TaxID=2821113 RepID=UPI001ADD1C26|nr:hypothetical protein [Shimia sp. R9_3]MBO9402621.1 hypothetical protein [Shimia sp. R9_3]
MTTPIAKIREDLALIVGGGFTPDGIGPDAYEAVAARAKAEPKRYLNALIQTYLGGDFDARMLSRLRPGAALELLAESDPETIGATAAKLLAHLDGLLVIYDSATDKTQLEALLPDDVLAMHQRLDRMRNRLRPLLEAAP